MMSVSRYIKWSTLILSSICCVLLCGWPVQHWDWWCHTWPTLLVPWNIVTCTLAIFVIRLCSYVYTFIWTHLYIYIYTILYNIYVYLCTYLLIVRGKTSMRAWGYSTMVGHVALTIQHGMGSCHFLVPRDLTMWKVMMWRGTSGDGSTSGFKGAGTQVTMCYLVICPEVREKKLGHR